MGTKILIVEDEFLVALELEDILSEAGHEVIGIAPDRATVMTIADAPQVALVDLNLRDGPSGTAIAMDLAQAYGTTIIYVTANPGQIAQPAPTAIGVVQKPFSQSAVLAAVAFATGAAVQRRLPPEIELYDKRRAG
jgi:DNA-binding response OmpR family regulator